MNQHTQRLLLIATIAAAGAMLTLVFRPALAQTGAPDASRGAPQDWSHRHHIYSNVDTRDEVTRKGYRAFEEWQHRSKDPRFARAIAKKERFIQAARERESSPQQIWTPSPFSREPQHQWINSHRKNPPPAAPDVQRDWSNVMGGAAGVGKAGVFPAKFGVSFNTANCASDFVVYTTASSGTTGSGALATQNGRFTGAPSNGQTVTITNGTRSLVLTASTSVGSNTGLTFQVLGTGGSTAILRATNLANAINRNGGTVGVTATANVGQNGRVTVTAITHGTGGNSIVLAETLNGFSWSGNLAGGSGTAGQPTIIAFNQLYKTTCGTVSTPVPATYWSYNTGTGAFTETSPVLSLDGTQVAFIQRTGTIASLVLLKWSSASPGTVGAPTIPASVTIANYRNCTAPCMTVNALNGNPNDTNSSPYYVYGDDVLYVGDDGGKLHMFTGVFNGTPGEVTSNGWPVTVSSGRKLSSPVYDYQSGKVFVGSAADGSTGGKLHSVNATDHTVVDSATLSATNSGGVADSPIVDSSAQKVYAFVGTDTGPNDNAYCQPSPCMAVHQFDTGFTGGSGDKRQVGNANASSKLYAGSFDEAYYASANYTGYLYVCGSLSNASKRPTAWRITISNNAMAAGAQEGYRMSNADSDCGPITMMTNGTNEYAYLSVTAGGNRTGCTGACLYLWNLTTSTYGQGTQPNAALAAPGGTSGIIVDNISSTPGASQIYYSTLISPGNAIQASQAGLQ